MSIIARAFFVAAAVLLLVTSCAAADAINLGSIKKCDVDDRRVFVSSFTASNLNFGEEATIDANLQYKKLQSSELFVTLKVLSFVTLVSDQKVDFCDQGFTAESSNSNSCPGDGNYFVKDYSFHIPEFDNAVPMMGTIKMEIRDENDVLVGCHKVRATLDATQGAMSKIHMTPARANGFGFAIAGFLLGAAGLAYVKKARTGKVEHAAKESSFAKMEGPISDGDVPSGSDA